MYIPELVVIEQYMNRHIGKHSQLLHHICKDKKCHRLRLESGYQRKDSHRFYLNLGFEQSSHHFSKNLGTIFSKNIS